MNMKMMLRVLSSLLRSRSSRSHSKTLVALSYRPNTFAVGEIGGFYLVYTTQASTRERAERGVHSHPPYPPYPPKFTTTLSN